MTNYETPFEHTQGAVRQAPKQRPNIVIDFTDSEASSGNVHVTPRGKVVVALAAAAIVGVAAYGAREHNTITIPSENQEHNVFNVGSTVTVGTGAAARKVKPTDISTIASLAYPGRDYRDLTAVLIDEVVKYNEAQHYSGDPHTLQEGTPLILPPDAHIGDHVDASAPSE